MRHADDGTLHALLDGALGAESPDRAAEVEAHLEHCADCRARLDAAATLRDRAGSILGATEPAAALPDFGEVLARRAAAAGVGGAAAAGAGGVGAASAARDRLRRRTRLTRRLAWAASLVVALGTGYLIGQEFGFDPGADRADRAERAAVRETTPPPQSEAMEAAEEEAGAGGPARAEAFAADAANAEEGGAEGPEASVGAERAASGGRSDAGAAAGQVEPPAPTEQADPPAASAAKVREPEAVAAQVQTMAEARRMTEPAGALAAEEGPAAAPHRIQLRAAAGRSLVAGPSALLTDDATAWAEVDVGRARALLDGDLLVLPEAEVRSTRIAASGGVVAVESVQALPGEILVQVRQIRGLGELLVVTPAPAGDQPADRAEVAGAPVAGAPEIAGEPEPTLVSVDTGPYRLVVRGPLSPEALRALALRARPMDRP